VTDGRFSLGTAAVRAEPSVLRDPNIVKVVAAHDGRALYFSRAPIPYLRDAEDAPVQRPLIWQHIGVYAYTSIALQNWVSLPATPLEEIERLEQLRPLVAGIPMGVSLTEETVIPGIDTEEDLERANREWTASTTG
jgi:3-deoxy-manno-octulosonate cytidylyltransferase (CMP-KDO synthetase)